MTNWLQSFHQQLPSANQFWRNSRHRQHWQDIFLISCIVVVYTYETIRQEVDSGEPRHRSTVAKDWNNQQTRNITTRKWMIKPLHLRLWPKWSCLNAWRVVFSMECLEFLSSMVAKIMERSALKSSVTHAASCLFLSEWRNWHKSWGITAITADSWQKASGDMQITTVTALHRLTSRVTVFVTCCMELCLPVLESPSLTVFKFLLKTFLFDIAFFY